MRRYGTKNNNPHAENNLGDAQQEGLCVVEIFYKRKPVVSFQCMRKQRVGELCTQHHNMGKAVHIPADKPEIFVDGLRNVTFRNWKQACHLGSTDREALHKFAAAIGLKRHWFDHDHYDLSPRYRDAAIAAGAIAITSRQLLREIR